MTAGALMSTISPTFGPFEKELTHFLKEMESEDELGVVVRCAIHIEHQVLGFVKDALPNGDAIDRRDWEYSDLLTLAQACDLSPQVLAPARAIAKIRNQFAHNLDYALDKNASGSLQSTLTGVPLMSYRAAVKDLYNRKKQGTKIDMDLDRPLDQFKMIAYIVILSVTALRIKATRGTANSKPATM
ncbi:hypothetical protein XM25_15305 [Devosia sp. H5989]|nr:hypothetical protein XM25_15305 [Devosia sp. H5989]